MVSQELSATQNIENICFAEDGALRTEFDNLFKALFSKAERHIAIVEAIATKTKGLTREEIIEILEGLLVILRLGVVKLRKKGRRLTW